MTIDEQTPTDQLLMELADAEESLAGLLLIQMQLQVDIPRCQERKSRINELLDSRHYGLDGMTPVAP